MFNLDLTYKYCSIWEEIRNTLIPNNPSLPKGAKGGYLYVTLPPIKEPGDLNSHKKYKYRNDLCKILMVFTDDINAIECLNTFINILIGDFNAKNKF